MDLKEAVQAAKQHVSELFEDEGISNIGLEEVRFEKHSHEWLVTVGFERRWDRPSGAISAVLEPAKKRTYKVVRLNNEDGELQALTDGLLPGP